MEYAGILQKAELFKEIDDKDLESMLSCLGAEIRELKKDETALFAGDRPRHVGLVLSGQLHVIREDSDGNRSILADIDTGGMFAEALCCAGVLESPVTVIANTGAAIMLLNFSRILSTCPNSCAFHAKLIENMLGIIASKNLHLQSRMEIVCLKSVRAKVLRYLNSFAPRREITIPFNREELADYLNVERSALSHELARMQKDGLIMYRKNKFVLS